MEGLGIVLIFNWIPRCSHSIWSTSNSHSRSRCWSPAVLVYKECDISKLHRPVPRSHSPSAHPLLPFSLLSPSQTILVSLLLLFCHCFLGEKHKSTSYFSHAVTAIIYSHTVTGQFCRKTIAIARQRTIALHFMCWVKTSVEVLISLSWGTDLNALWVRHKNHNSDSAKGVCLQARPVPQPIMNNFRKLLMAS